MLIVPQILPYTQEIGAKKIVATKGHLGQKCTEIYLHRGVPRTPLSELTTLPDPLAGGEGARTPKNPTLPRLFGARLTICPPWKKILRASMTKSALF